MREHWHASRIEEPKTAWKEERLSSHPTFRPLRCLEICKARREEVEVDLAMDEVVSISLDGECVATLVALPIQLEEMAVGFLVGEGLVKSVQDIASIKEDKGSLVCRTRNQSGERKEVPPDSTSPGGLTDHSQKSIGSDFKIKAAAILGAVDQLNDLAKLWRRTGATHNSMICNSEGVILASCEDIGRSNSVDKAVGAALLAGIDLSNCALITSGRLSEAIVAKAARAGFPVIISRSAPMNSAVQLAEEIGMTLVAFARSPNLYVYAWPERIMD